MVADARIVLYRIRLWLPYPDKSSSALWEPLAPCLLHLLLEFRHVLDSRQRCAASRDGLALPRS